MEDGELLGKVKVRFSKDPRHIGTKLRDHMSLYFPDSEVGVGEGEATVLLTYDMLAPAAQRLFGELFAAEEVEVVSREEYSEERTISNAALTQERQEKRRLAQRVGDLEKQLRGRRKEFDLQLEELREELEDARGLYLRAAEERDELQDELERSENGLGDARSEPQQHKESEEKNPRKEPTKKAPASLVKKVKLLKEKLRVRTEVHEETMDGVLAELNMYRALYKTLLEERGEGGGDVPGDVRKELADARDELESALAELEEYESLQSDYEKLKQMYEKVESDNVRLRGKIAGAIMDLQGGLAQSELEKKVAEEERTRESGGPEKTRSQKRGYFVQMREEADDRKEVLEPQWEDLEERLQNGEYEAVQRDLSETLPEELHENVELLFSKELLDYAQASKILGVGESQISNLNSGGYFDAVRNGGSRKFIPRAQLAHFMLRTPYDGNWRISSRDDFEEVEEKSAA